MEHHHHHSHQPVSPGLARAFVIGILLNGGFVIVEFVTGLSTNSLALLSDAGHNLSDVATLALSLFAFRIARRKADKRYTYGFQKGTILASLLNAVILLIAVGSIGWEAIQRFLKPEETKGTVISLVAGIGIFVNAISAFLIFRDREKDINVKGVYLHLASDALVSIGVVIAGLLISWTGYEWIDPLISLLIMAVVTYGTWDLLVHSLQMSMDAVPSNVEIEAIEAVAAKIKGVKRIHHIHVWAMSTTKTAMTAYLQLGEGISESGVEELKEQLRHELAHLNIHHVTLETGTRATPPSLED